MKIALIHNARFPTQLYGGTERVVWWLAKGLSELGHSVVLVCQKESICPFAEIIPFDTGNYNTRNIESSLPNVSLFHYFSTPEHTPTTPYLVTIGGNGKPGEVFLSNTTFVSRNHAHRHNAECFVYNGIDPDDYRFSDVKKNYLLFLAKASWRVKNVRGAIRVARNARRDLRILGGKRFLFNHWRGVCWEGMVGGEEKLKFIADACGLLFPVIWNEPFGLAVVESLVSGTPVIASKRGSLPELICHDVGKLCNSEQEFQEAIESLPSFRPDRCREWVMSHFHYRLMTTKYVGLYEKILAGEKINRAIPKATSPPEQLYPLARQTRISAIPGLS